MGDFEGSPVPGKSHVACPMCPSSNAASYYLDDKGDEYVKCFSCSGFQYTDGRKLGGKSTKVPGAWFGEIKDLPDRNIKAITCQKYNYMVATWNSKNSNGDSVDKVVHIACVMEDGKIVGQHARFVDDKKVFPVNRKLSPIKDKLIGAHLVRPNDHKVIITEGEIDMLTIAQEVGIHPVVSLPCGTGSVKEAIRANKEWLDKMDEVIICFDMDEVGQEAAKIAGAILAPGKAKYAHLEEKDANDMLVSGKTEALINAVLRPSEAPVEPSVKEDKEVGSLTSLDDYWDEICQLIVRGPSFSFPTLTKALDGHQLGVSNLVFAQSNKGKSTFIFTELFNLISKKRKVGILTTEQSVPNLIDKLTGMLLGESVPQYAEGVDEEMSDEIKAAVQEENIKRRQKKIEMLRAAKPTLDYLKFPKAPGRVALPEFERFVKECAAEGIQHVILDHVTSLSARSAGKDIKSWEALEYVTAKITEMAREYKMNILVVGHTNHDKKNVNQYSVKGSQNLANLFDNVIIMYEAEKPKETFSDGSTYLDYRILELVKVRNHGEYRGALIGLVYDTTTKRLEECSDIIGLEPVDRSNPQAGRRDGKEADKKPSAPKKKADDGRFRKSNSRPIQTEETDDDDGDI